METSEQHLRFAVDGESAGVRLDRYLAAQLPEMSRSRVQELMDEGRVLVEGTARKPSYRINPGDIVEIEIPPIAPAGVIPEAIPLEILYEDDALAIVNKPAGMVVHPGAGETSGTLVAALLHHFGGASHLSGVGGALRPGIVHRLDKGTSGALVIAKTNEAHLRLVEEFAERQVQKTYLALVRGALKENAGRIELPVARDLRHRTRMTARRRDGRPARTDWRSLLHLPGFTLLKANLHTGRTHQLRVHFSTQGHTVVGDTLYGAPKQPHAGKKILPPLGRNFLHAAFISFAHPLTGEEVEAKAPLPAELRDYLGRIGEATDTPITAIDAALSGFL